MSAKHTPGPWSVPHFARAHGCGCRYVFAGEYLGGIAEVYVDNGKMPSGGGNDCPSVDEATANARLIAAAPDLLSALRELLALGEQESIEDGELEEAIEDGELEEAKAAARAAIAKARGES